MYALVTDAPMSFPHLFIRSLVEVHRSSSTSHGPFFPVFIHRILLHLGLDKFPASELVHIIAPIGATFLRQKASSKRPRVKSSSSAPPHLPSSSDPITEEYVNPTVTVDPPPTSSLSDASLRSKLETTITVQVTQGHILVDVVVELQALRADLASSRRSPPPPFDDES